MMPVDTDKAHILLYLLSELVTNALVTIEGVQTTLNIAGASLVNLI